MLKSLGVGTLGLIMLLTVSPVWGQGSGHRNSSQHQWHQQTRHQDHQWQSHHNNYRPEHKRHSRHHDVQHPRQARHHYFQRHHYQRHNHYYAPHVSGPIVVTPHPAAPLFFLGGLVLGLSAH